MQFVLLIHQGTTPLPDTPEWDALPKDEQQAVYADYAALNQRPRASRRAAARTAGPTAHRPRRQDGTTLATDGPYVDDEGPVGGFLVMEADDIDAAIEIAARIPAARLGGTIEMRPVAKYW